MTWVGYTANVTTSLCPYCNSPLSELSDMWGPFYACEECGYEVDEVETEMERPRPNGNLVFASGFRPAADEGGGGEKPIRQPAEAGGGLPLAS